MHRVKSLLITVPLWLSACCASHYTRHHNYIQYAQVHVNSADSHGASVQVFDGSSGQHLGDTPFYLYMQKEVGAANPILSLLSKKESDIRICSWTLSQVTRWAPSKEEAMDAFYTNNIRLNPCR